MRMRDIIDTVAMLGEQKVFDVSIKLIDKHTGDALVTFFAYHGRTKIGHLQINMFDHRVPDARHVEKSYIEPAFRRQGVGTKLYNAAEEYLAAKGLRLIPSSKPAMSDDAIAFWQNRTRLGEAAGDEYVFTVPVEALAAIYDPFESSPWFDIDSISPDAVAEAIERQDFDAGHHEPNIMKPPSSDYHVRRIAYLVAHPDPEPIVVVPNQEGSFELDDGFHRLAAAIYRGDPTIRVAFGGTKKQLRRWLGQ